MIILPVEISICQAPLTSQVHLIVNFLLLPSTVLLHQLLFHKDLANIGILLSFTDSHLFACLCLFLSYFLFLNSN